MTPIPRTNSGNLREINHRFYDAMWRDARLVEAAAFQYLAADHYPRRAVAPAIGSRAGLRPRLPVEGTYFVDLSAAAVEKLRARAASVIVGSVTALPFETAQFDLVCAFDIVEHVEDEEGALSELSRVCAGGGAFVLAVPLHPSRWTPFDEMVGHCRRYEPQRLLDKLHEHGFVVESSAAYGMQPKSTPLLNFGIWWLTHHRERAMWLYNRVMVPLGVHFQSKLSLRSGMIDTTGVDEVLLVCRKRN
jgi:SAM-dependent methyltransferase